MYYTINNLPPTGQPYGQVFQTSDGQLVKRIESSLNDCPEIGHYLVKTVIAGGKSSTEISIMNGYAVPNPIWVPNSVFSDENGQYLIRTLTDNEVVNAAKANDAGIGYLVNRQYEGGGIEYIRNGKKFPLPKTLFNEFGVPYHMVKFETYGLVCKALFGYVVAYKVEPVYLISDVPGTPVNSVINGVNEHQAVLKDGEVLVQNMYHGERYKQKRTKFEGKYEFSGEKLNGYEVWKPLYVEEEWTMTDENVVGPLWGSFEFLAKAAINVNNVDDIYGCNYAVFSGDDTAKGSHKKLRRFMPKNPVSREDAMAILGKCREDQVFAEVFLAMSSQVDFVEVPLGVCEI